MWPKMLVLEGTDVTYVVGQMRWLMNREIFPSLSRTPAEGDRGFYLHVGLHQRGQVDHRALPWYSPLRRAEGL